MKAESLVIADQHAAVNTFPGLVHTARHTMGVGFTRRRYANPQGGQATTVGSATGVKSYQGSSGGTWGGITSFSRIMSDRFAADSFLLSLEHYVRNYDLS